MARTAEESIRAVLRRVQTAEEVSSLRSGLLALQLQEVERDEDKITQCTAALTECFERAQIPQELRETYYCNSEEEMCLADARSQRLSLILRARAVLARMYSG